MGRTTASLFLGGGIDKPPIELELPLVLARRPGFDRQRKVGLTVEPGDAAPVVHLRNDGSTGLEGDPHSFAIESNSGTDPGVIDVASPSGLEEIDPVIGGRRADRFGVLAPIDRGAHFVVLAEFVNDVDVAEAVRRPA